MKIFKYMFIGLLLTYSSMSFSGEIAKGKLEEITNITGTQKAFAIKMSTGATGPCANEWIIIKSVNQDSDNYKFAFSLATTAFVSGKTVRIHNYSSDSCDGATFIGLYKN